MAITLSLPASSLFTVAHIPALVDFVATDASVTGFSSTLFSGSGFFNGGVASYTATGSGFVATNIAGSTYITAGVIDTVSFTSNLGSHTITNVDFDMAVFSPIIISDLNGTDILAIEKFTMSKDWNVTLGDMDDIALKGSLVVDGALFNPTGDDVVRAGGGNDNLFTGDGDDQIFGGSGGDILNGGRGNDIVRGGVGADRLQGEAGSDRLFGDRGNDKLYGSRGNDVLNGGKGNDKLTGGGGADDFIFGNKSGKDVIRDFNALNNNEDIDLSAVTAIVSFRDLKNNHMIQSGTDVIIDDKNGTEITLLNVDIADLHKADFLF